MKLGEVIQLHQVSLHSDEKNNSFMSNTFKRRSVRYGQANWALDSSYLFIYRRLFFEWKKSNDFLLRNTRLDY